MEFGLRGKRVAILATDGVERVELESPRQALDGAGAITHVISDKSGEIRSFDHLDEGASLPVDRSLDDALASEYDALLLPGGVANPDALRLNARAVQFVREFMLAEKPVAAICHAAWLLVEADAVRGRTITSWPSLRRDVENAGGSWVDEEVQIDGQMVTSRKPDDLPAFNEAILRHFADKLDEAKVDSVSEQSFPASDPPQMP